MEGSIAGFAIAGFEWDDGNRSKRQKHGVSISEIEILFTRAVLILPDHDHSYDEERLRGIGETPEGRYVFLVFTIRAHGGKRYIRPISARYMRRKEIETYEKAHPEIQNRRRG